MLFVQFDPITNENVQCVFKISFLRNLEALTNQYSCLPPTLSAHALPLGLPLVKYLIKPARDERSGHVFQHTYNLWHVYANRVSYCSSDTNLERKEKKCTFLLCFWMLFEAKANFNLPSDCVFLSVWFFQLPRRRCGFWPTLMQSLKSIFEKSYWQNFGKCNCHDIT